MIIYRNEFTNYSTRASRQTKLIVDTIKNRKHKWLDSIVYSRLDKSVGGLKFKSVIRGLLGLLTKSTGVIEVFSCRKTLIYSQNGLPFVHFRLKDCIT